MSRVFRHYLIVRPIEVDIYHNSVPVNQTKLFCVANAHVFYDVYILSDDESSLCTPSCDGSFSIAGTAGTFGISKGYSPVVTKL